jgi:hypothetical protein
MSDPIAAMTASMARTSSGFAAVIGGVLDIRSASETADMAAYNALFLVGINLISNCNDPDCDCKRKALARLRPDIKIVPVTMEAKDGP